MNEVLMSIIEEIEKEKSKLTVQGCHNIYVGLGMAEDIVRKYFKDEND